MCVNQLIAMRDARMCSKEPSLCFQSACRAGGQGKQQHQVGPCGVRHRRREEIGCQTPRTLFWRHETPEKWLVALAARLQMRGDENLVNCDPKSDFHSWQSTHHGP